MNASRSVRARTATVLAKFPGEEFIATYLSTVSAWIDAVCGCRYWRRITTHAINLQLS